MPFNVTHLSKSPTPVPAGLPTELTNEVEAFVAGKAPRLRPVGIELLHFGDLCALQLLVGGQPLPEAGLFGHLEPDVGPARLQRVLVLI